MTTYRIKVVLLNRPLYEAYDYVLHTSDKPQLWARVQVPFGNTHNNTGIIVACTQEEAQAEDKAQTQAQTQEASAAEPAETAVRPETTVCTPAAATTAATAQPHRSVQKLAAALSAGTALQTAPRQAGPVRTVSAATPSHHFVLKKAMQTALQQEGNPFKIFRLKDKDNAAAASSKKGKTATTDPENKAAAGSALPAATAKTAAATADAADTAAVTAPTAAPAAAEHSPADTGTADQSAQTANPAQSALLQPQTEDKPAAGKRKGGSKALKEAQLLDSTAVISPDIAGICQFAARYYHHPLGQCFAVALPSLLREGKPARAQYVTCLQLNDTLKPQTSAEADTLKSLLSTVKNDRQREIISVLAEHGGKATRQELLDRGCSQSALRTLQKYGTVEQVQEDPLAGKPWQERFAPAQVLKTQGFALNYEQQAALQAINAAQGYKVFLLSGITGSGKTEVYLQAIEHVLSQGKSALVLVPEIALTPQTFGRFYNRFAVPVVSMHSQLGDSERLTAWLTMQKGQAGVLIGTRSALFTPIPNLGLIVLDEEHDSSFKQGDGLRYHARTLALQRAKLCNCPVILGSATPCLDSVYHARCGDYELLQLTKRAGEAALPDISIVDLRQEPLTYGMETGIGQILEDRIGEETVKGNQVLLFLNRRGYAHHLVCHNCGKIFMCPHCDNVLTVHRRTGQLMCHVCDATFRIPRVCPDCGEPALMENGFGTEQIEEFLHLRYPDAGIERIDRDSVKSKSELDEKLHRIRSGQSQILTGTQMLAKGHDFPDVTLVGIIDVDGGLFSDDFRSPELTVQLLTQVAGRSGRAGKKGQVIIQTHHPDNVLLNQIARADVSYLDMAFDMLYQRRQLNLPPFSCQAFLLSNSPVRERAHAMLLQLRDSLLHGSAITQYPDVAVGPVMPDKTEKKYNRYHFHLQLCAQNQDSLSAVLDEAVQAARTLKPDYTVRFGLDVDPISMY